MTMTVPTLSPPTYTPEPHEYEQRLAMANRIQIRPARNFSKASKNGVVRLDLRAQGSAETPIYGSQSSVDGTVNLSTKKMEDISSVEVRVEGKLCYKEIAEGGTNTSKLKLNSAVLWRRDLTGGPCPTSLPFSLPLPPTFVVEGKTYPLGPTFTVKLDGLPGFIATIDYSVSAVVNQPDSVPALVPRVSSNTLGIHIGSTAVTIPFIYHPRARPAVALPRLPAFYEGSPEWQLHATKIGSRTSNDFEGVMMKLYLPASRVFCISQPIPFRLMFESPAHTMEKFVPQLSLSSRLASCEISVVRQSALDVRWEKNGGGETSIWRVDKIGKGFFTREGETPTRISFSGEINIDSSVTVGGFKAHGLQVKDFVLLTVTPDLRKSQFMDVRQTVSIRLVTDPWVADGAGIGYESDRESLIGKAI